MSFWNWLASNKVTPEDIGVFIIVLIVLTAGAVAVSKER
jgi:hypothetical protein